MLYQIKEECDVPLPSSHTLHQLFEPFHFFTAGDQLVVLIGVMHISCHYIKYNRGNRRKKNKRTNTWG